MTGQQRLIPLDSKAEWDQALRGIPHAFAHTWGSCQAMHLTTGSPTFLYSWERGRAKAVCAIAERGDEGLVDVVTPYGFGGLVGVGLAYDVLEEWGAFAREREYVCGYLGLNPELADPVLRQSPDYVEHNDIYVLELDRGLGALHGALSVNRRRELRAFARSSARLVQDRDRLAAYFVDHVDDFLRARTADPSYAFSRATWESLVRLEDVLLVGVESPDGQIEAVSLFAHTPYSAEYLFGISAASGHRYSAPLIWTAATILGERGVPRLNLGGGVRRGDGIAAFKERFGGKRMALGALRQVYRPDVYSALCRAAGRGPTDRTGFFPAYRAPRHRHA